MVLRDVVMGNRRTTHKKPVIDVCVFDCLDSYERCSSEEDYKKRITAKFCSYNDAIAFAWKLCDTKQYYLVLVR